MILEQVKSDYPNVFAKITEDIFETRELLVVDENYEDEIDSEEASDLEPDEYNHFIYVSELLYVSMGEECVNQLIEKLNNNEKFDDFLAVEHDLFGVQTDLKEEDIMKVVFGHLEEIIS